MPLISLRTPFLRLIPLLLLAGCAALQPQPAQVEPPAYQQHLQRIGKIRNFGLDGRIGVLTPQKGFSGTMRWHHHEAGDTIAFYSPLGTQLGELNADAQGVTLTTGNQKTYRAENAETLTEQTLGWSLPLTGLPDWALGRPTAGAHQILAWDGVGRITRMRQNGWDIEYPTYQENSGLPGKIVLKSPKLDLKLVVDNWQTDAE